MSCEEKTLIKLVDVKTENIEMGVEYNIYEKESEDGNIVCIWGENTLLLNENELIFTIEESIPFKYYRGLLGLEERSIFYIKSIKEYFKNDETLTINSNCEDEDNYMFYQIEIKSTDLDVTKFISKILGFEFLFENKLKTIEEKINKLIQ